MHDKHKLYLEVKVCIVISKYRWQTWSRPAWGSGLNVPFSFSVDVGVCVCVSVSGPAAGVLFLPPRVPSPSHTHYLSV